MDLGEALDYVLELEATANLAPNLLLDAAPATSH
jgi:hypothetical protein